MGDKTRDRYINCETENQCMEHGYTHFPKKTEEVFADFFGKENVVTFFGGHKRGTPSRIYGTGYHLSLIHI